MREKITAYRILVWGVQFGGKLFGTLKKIILNWILGKWVLRFGCGIISGYRPQASYALLSTTFELLCYFGDEIFQWQSKAILDPQVSE
jgi:hypothetical protein